MKRLQIIGLILAVAASLCSCQSADNHYGSLDKADLLPVPSSEYLGQIPPGDQPQLFAPGIVSAGENDMSVSISPDGKTFYLFRTAPFYSPRFMLESKWSGNGWRRFSEVSFFDKKRADSYHFFAPDGQRSYFQVFETRSFADGTEDIQDLFYVEKTDDGWGERIRIDFGSEFRGLEAYPTVALNGNLYFSALYQGENRDLFFASYLDGKYSDPQRLSEFINSPEGEYHPFIAPDESYIIYDSGKADGMGNLDLWINFRLENGSWSEGINLGSQVNSENSDMRPYVSPDSKYLFFASDRKQEITLPIKKLDSYEVEAIFGKPGNGLQDIYWMKADFLWELKKLIEE